MAHKYDAALSPSERKAQVQIYYDTLPTLRDTFTLRKQQNDCPVWDVNEFKVLTCLGAGMFGTAYRAERGMELCAIKRTEKKTIRARNLISDAINEKLYLYAMRDCPFIIELFATFKDQLNLYLIMECAELCTIRSLQDAYGYGVPEAVVRRVIAQIVLGLQYMHACGVMYRDLKEENLLLCAGGRVKIGGIGQSCDLSTEARAGYCRIYYQAPEAYFNSLYYETVDWWSLGVLMYSLICNKHPYCEESDFKDPEQIYGIIMESDIKFNRPKIAETSEAFKDLLSQLLNKNFIERIGSSREGSSAIQNHEWFGTTDWYEVLYSPDQLGIDYGRLEIFAVERDVTELYPFKRFLPDSEDPRRGDFADF